MIIQNSQGVKSYNYITKGRSRKRIYYDPCIKRMPHGWLVRKPIKYNGKREIARRLRQMNKISSKLEKAA